ncbi:DUF4179 domain-containing protein [Halalkalibacter okhensis]|uniref:DUF4179 domain-containing protein n=1 Tax=Halalkalibacter okhensis TaxID=333138 RepID=A0A0B0IE42_9BACI|nr:DUF4179 domain-containing protein [Halalkalibacter okhensis]KHF39157.1 hypothetical protein LQ50_17170 [Halalkalibacter okhensis]
MNKIEKKLKEEKQRIDKLEAPSELEERLRTALTQTKQRRYSPKKWFIAAIAMFLFFTIGYHYHAFAFYGKKIFGFDEVMNGTLQHLNEEGMGQIIDETYQLHNQAELTIEAVMTDANRMIIYYTVTDDEGNVDHVHDQWFRPRKITGLFTNVHYEGGQWLVNEEGTELKGTMEFASPSPFSKTLTLHFWNQDEQVEKTHAFSYDPNQAMQTIIKQKINETVQVDKGHITFDSIVATPSSTMIEGSLRVDNFDRVNLGLHGIELVANGHPIDLLGSSSSSSLTGTTFDIRYDALPEELESLILHVKEFVGYSKLDAVISLENEDSVQTKLDGEEMTIKQVEHTSDTTEVTIVTKESLLLDDVYIGSDQEKIELLTTINQREIPQVNGSFLKERTLVFNTTEKPDQLFIGGIHYVKEYNEVIEVMD